jgi:hypothetical protein
MSAEAFTTGETIADQWAKPETAPLRLLRGPSRLAGGPPDFRQLPLIELAGRDSNRKRDKRCAHELGCRTGDIW